MTTIMLNPRIPDNVIRDLRTSAKLTQQELADKANVTVARVLREEQFIYVEPSPSILGALSEVFSKQFTKEEIVKDYCDGRSLLHRQFFDDMVTSPDHLAALNRAVDYAVDYYDEREVKSPTRLFREHLFEHYGLPSSAIKFCMYTGMHPATLSDIETGKVDWAGAVSFKEIMLRLGCTFDMTRHMGVIHDSFYVRRVL